MAGQMRSSARSYSGNACVDRNNGPTGRALVSGGVVGLEYLPLERRAETVACDLVCDRCRVEVPYEVGDDIGLDNERDAIDSERGLFARSTHSIDDCLSKRPRPFARRL